MNDLLKKTYGKLGLTGTLGLIGIGLSVYSYEKNKKEKLPIYAYTDPLELDTSAIPKIKIFFEEELRDSEFFPSELYRLLPAEDIYPNIYPKPGIILPRVVATKILFLNRGKESIERFDILENLFIEISSSGKILYAKEIAATRKVCDIQIEPFKEKGVYTNKAQVSFRILEKDDGALLYIVHTGPKDAVPKITGEIKGAKKGIKCLGKLRKSERTWLRILFWACLPLPFLSAFILYTVSFERSRERLTALGVLVSSVINLVIVLYFRAKTFIPPELDPFK